MKAVLKWVGIVLTALAVIGCALVAAYLLDWAYWKAALVLLAVVALCMAVVILLRLNRRRGRAKALAREPVGPAVSEATRGEVAERRRALDARWKAFLGQLRRARVRGKGDPVYALPWHLMLGEDGAGKTSAVRNSLLAVPSTEGGEGARGGKGQELGWHILEEAIVLDAPGRYAFPRDEVDEAEWAEFLSRLVRARKEEPLNGVVVALPAKALAAGREGELKTKAVALGKRLDELTRTLGAVVPVYLLVTQCDLVGGMARFFGYLPEAAFSGAMGGLNDERGLERPRETFLARVFDRLYEDLRQLRLTVLGDVPPDEVHPQTVLFPEEFLELKAPLGAFVDALFEKNPYREPPFFRGVYFASARQEGVPASASLARLGLQEETLPLPGEGKSLFLKGFFGQVLPHDRSLVAPTSRAVSWRRLTQSATLAGWVLLCAALGVVLSVSFGRNLTGTRQVDRDVPPRPYLGSEFGPNLQLSDQLRSAVLQARARQQDWLLPRFGLNQAEELADRLAEVFVERFRSGVAEPLDKNLDRELLAVSDGRDPSRVARFVDYLSRRTRLLQIAVDGEGTEETLAKEPQPDFTLVLNVPAGDDLLGTSETVQRGYRSYLAWQGDPGVLAKELETEQARLANLLSQKAIGFAWLTEWGNLQEGLPEITLGQYWGTEPPPGDRPVLVQRAYTAPGWQAISEFIATISRSVTGGEGIGAALNAFQASYRKEYLSQWERFLREFQRGAAGWSGRQKRVELAGRLAASSSPYARLLADCPAALAPAVGLAQNAEEVPEWVALVYRYERLVDPKYQAALKGGEGVVGRWASRGGQLLADLKARLRDQAAAEESALQQDAKALPFLTAYQESLQQMAASAQAPAAAFKMAKDAYVEAETSVGEPQQPVARNRWAQAKLSGTLSQGRPKADVFWQLLAEPAGLVWGVLLDESEVYLQQKWEEEVLAEAKNLVGWDLVDALQGDSGKIWEFQLKYLEPFLTKDPRRGYVSKELYGDGLHLSGAYLRTANLGKLGGKAFDRSYRVQVSALPTSANPGATVQPHRTRLVLQCASENQELVNLNYPIGKSFDWNPRECSDVTLEIAVGDAVLVKRYTGYDGFLRFLRDFRSGARVFQADEFPAEQRRGLEGYRVKNITVSYDLKGQGSALRLAEYDPSAVPSRLVE